MRGKHRCAVCTKDDTVEVWTEVWPDKMFVSARCKECGWAGTSAVFVPEDTLKELADHIASATCSVLKENMLCARYWKEAK